MDNLVLAYPWWFILLCLLLGVIYALALYLGNPHFKEKPLLNTFLGGLRGLTISIIAFLLLNPIIKHIEEFLKPPILAIGIDQSTSMGQWAAEKGYDLTGLVENLKKGLGKKYELHFHGIGPSVSDTLYSTYDQNETDISQFVHYLNDHYSHLNLVGSILVSDGIFNKGQNPIYTDKKFTAPIHTVMVGDTSLPQDINIKNIFHNEVAFLNDRFEVEADIEGQHCQGQSIKVSLWGQVNGVPQLMEEKSIAFQQPSDFKTLSFEIPARTVGVQQFELRASKGGSEKNLKNNQRKFFIEILDSRLHILLVKNAPHPDISAFKQMVSRTENLELEVTDVQNALSKLGRADLVVLHEVPSRSHPAEDLIANLIKAKKPRLFVLGDASNLPTFNKAQTVLEINSKTSTANEVQAQFHGDFKLFINDEATLRQLSEAPPLISPFGEYRPRGGSVILASQRIGNIDTEYPLIVFADRNGVKEGVICGTGLWKWRITDHFRNNSFDKFDHFMSSIFQYLSVKENNEPFRVHSDKNIYDEEETIHFTAEVYNKSFERIVQPDVNLSIRSSNGDDYQYTFSREEDTYILDAGSLPSGDYRYAATTQYNGETLKEGGHFVVQKTELEYYNTVAQYDILRALSSQTGGVSVEANKSQGLIAQLNDTNVKPVLDYQTESTSLIHLKWLFALLLALLAMEWFLRRFYGRY